MENAAAWPTASQRAGRRALPRSPIRTCGRPSVSVASTPRLCPHTRRDCLPQLAQRLALAGDPLIELLVVVPFRPEEPIEDARPQAVVAGIPGVVQRVVSGARQHFAQPAIVIFRFQLEVCVAE